MANIVRAYDWLIGALAWIAGLLIFLIFAFIILDVTSRELIGYSFKFTIGTVEYMMLYLTCLSAPWLLRTHGHVYIEAFTSRVPPVAKRACEILVCVFSIFAAGVFTWIAMQLLMEKLASGEVDIRDIDIPGWMIAAPLPVCYSLIAIECLRFLFGRDSIWRGDNAPPEAL
ncbi:MAG: TRAP transporter small permease [Beijerinckiaceae bacterium]